ncbi:MAG: hypothetical protein AAFN93_24435 [Bacteroidota bacterium]
MSKVREFINADGTFKKWSDFKKSMFENARTWLRGEIDAQIEKALLIEKQLKEELEMEDYPVFTHLSSHHNSLTFL